MPGMEHAQALALTTSGAPGHPLYIKGAAPYLEMGVKHFCIGWDVRVLQEWWRVNGEGMRALLGASEKAAPVKETATTHATPISANAAACVPVEPPPAISTTMPMISSPTGIAAWRSISVTRR